MQCFPLEAFVVTLALNAFCTFPQRLPLWAGGGWRPAVEETPPDLLPTSCGPQLPSRKIHLGHLGGHGHSCLMYHELLQPLLLLTLRHRMPSGPQSQLEAHQHCPTAASPPPLTPEERGGPSGVSCSSRAGRPAPSATPTTTQPPCHSHFGFVAEDTGPGDSEGRAEFLSQPSPLFC